MNQLYDVLILDVPESYRRVMSERGPWSIWEQPAMLLREAEGGARSRLFLRVTRGDKNLVKPRLLQTEHHYPGMGPVRFSRGAVNCMNRSAVGGQTRLPSARLWLESLSQYRTRNKTNSESQFLTWEVRPTAPPFSAD